MALFFYFICFARVVISQFIFFSFYNTHQVLVGLPQGVGGLGILYVVLFYIILCCINLLRLSLSDDAMTMLRP